MELPGQLCLWLSEAGVLKDKYEKGAKSVVLSESDSEQIELGLILQVFPVNFPYLPKENQLNTSNSKVSRLSNWNLLLKPLESLGISVNSDLKALIVAGDREQVIEVLARLQKALTVLTRKKLNFASFEGGVLLNNLNPSLPLRDCQSVLEFFVVAICQAFSVTVKVAVGLLAQGGSFLSQVIKKGIKHEFDLVLTWYDLNQQNFESLLKLLKDENFLFQGLSLLKGGLGSDSEAVQDRCSVFFADIFRYDKESLTEWLMGDSELINLLFGLIESRLDVTKITKFVFDYSGFELLSKALSEHCGDNEKYLKITQRLFPAFIELNLIGQVFDSGLVRNWIELCLNSEGDKGIYLTFLCDLWVYFIDYFDKEEELSNNILNFIKKLIRDGSRGLKILVIGQVFEVLNTFTKRNIKYSPILYKILIFALVEHFQVHKIREFILINFARVLAENQVIPLGPLVEPLVKRALVLKNLNFQIHDFDFYLTLGRHSGLSVKDAILLIDLCGKVLVSDTVYILAAEIPFLIITSRFIENETFQNYLLKFVSVIFNINANKKFYTEIYSGKSSRPIILLEKILDFGCFDFNEKLGNLLSFVQSDLKNVQDKNLGNLFGVLFESGLRMSLVPLQEAEKSGFSGLSVYPTRAIQAIEKIKQKREMRENNEKIVSDKKMVKNMVEKFNLKKEINKRRIELGIKSKFNEDDLVIVDSTYKKSSLDLNMIKDEFPETQNLIKCVFKKYRKVNKTLFSKYAGLAYKQSESLTPSFERIKVNKQTLTQSDFSLFLKHFGLLNRDISVSEMKAIFSELSKKSSKSISIDCFQDLLYMVSSFIASKNSAMGKFPEVICLLDFYASLYNSTDGIIPKHYFEEPDPGYADRDVIKGINLKLEENPNLVLNENYKKYEETEIIVKYQANIGRTSQKVVIEFLDALLFSTFGFHFLLPTLETSVKIRAKGVLKTDNLKNTDLGYLHKVESNPKFMKLSPHLKLHAIGLNSSENITMECSNLIDDLIYSVEKKSFGVISKVPKPAGSISNKIIQERQLNELERNQSFKKSENNRKLRHYIVSDLVEKNKIEKAYKEMQELQEKNMEMIKEKFKLKEEKQKNRLKQMETNEKIMKHKLDKLQQIRSNTSARDLIKDGSEISILPLKSLSRDNHKFKKASYNLKSSSVPRNLSNKRLTPL